MKYVKFALMGVGTIAAVLSMSYGILSAGVHGAIVVAACVIPVALGALGTFVKTAMPRWAAITSIISFGLAAMKTSGGPEGGDLEKIMMLAALGLVLSIVLAVKPEKAA